MSVITEYITDVVYNRADPRTKDWFLVSNPWHVIGICLAYVYFSTSLGPRIMRDRKPFQLRNTLIVYNFIQVVLSIYLVHEALMGGWATTYNYKCQPVDYSNTPQAMRMANGVYMYYMCKLIELLDTVFFVLRKKERQISFLHVYHHAMMPICAFIGTRFVPGGHATLLGLINSFIHILMYLYYMLAAFGPEVQKYLWWKKYLTSLQLVQFSIILVHNSLVLFGNCNYPKPLAFLLCINAGLFIYLFGSFYVKNYLTKSTSSADQKKVKEAAAATTNGSVTNGKPKTNGYANGAVPSTSNGLPHSNGHTNGYTNGHSKHPHDE